jgi:hypothetical protein
VDRKGVSQATRDSWELAGLIGVDGNMRFSSNDHLPGSTVAAPSQEDHAFSSQESAGDDVEDAGGGKTAGNTASGETEAATDTDDNGKPRAARARRAKPATDGTEDDGSNPPGEGEGAEGNLDGDGREGTARGARARVPNPYAVEDVGEEDGEEEETERENIRVGEIGPHPFVGEEGADLEGHVQSEADRRLIAVYGDTLHANDGTHLDGGIAEDKLWQRLWRR